MIHIRPAQAADQKTIERIVRDAGINPLSLDWHRFVIAEDNDAPSTSLRIVGVGQIKPHNDGSRELASIAVIPERRGQGVGGEIIRTLLAKERGVVYLTCREQLETFYTRFGFRRIGREEVTPYFRHIIRLANVFRALSRRGIRVVVMKKE